MKSYIIRVELLGTPAADTYARLHELMRESGFRQEAVTQAGASCQLPHAMYFGNSELEQLPLANILRTLIETRVWTHAVVMTIGWSTWAIAR